MTPKIFGVFFLNSLLVKLFDSLEVIFLIISIKKL